MDNLKFANCGKGLASNSGDCSLFLRTLEKTYESHNKQLPQNFQRKTLGAEIEP